jgi:hypothetical protein
MEFSFVYILFLKFQLEKHIIPGGASYTRTREIATSN